MILATIRVRKKNGEKGKNVKCALKSAVFYRLLNEACAFLVPYLTYYTLKSEVKLEILEKLHVFFKVGLKIAIFLNQ